MESGAGLLSEQEPHCPASYNAYNEEEPSFDYEEPSLEESPLCSSVWVDGIVGKVEEQEEMFLSATGGDIIQSLSRRMMSKKILRTRLKLKTRKLM